VDADADAGFEGYHGVKVDADALPRHPAAYASADALLLDAATLRALDTRQAGALAAYAAGCGRVVSVGVDAPLARALDATAGCGGRTVMHAASIAQAKRLLRESLASAVPEPMSAAGTGERLPQADATWQRVTVLVVAYLVAAAVAFALLASQALALAVAPLGALVAFAALHAIEPAPKLVLWSEADSGARRVRAHAATAAALDSARPCHPGLPVVLDFDPERGVVTGVEYDARLFRARLLCYSGALPAVRTIGIERLDGGALRVRNAGSEGWPQGLLVDAGRVRDLPALAPGERATLADAATGTAPPAAAERVPGAVLARAQRGRMAALWPIEQGAVRDLPAASSGWLLVTVPSS
jgi:hypothetical protein